MTSLNVPILSSTVAVAKLEKSLLFSPACLHNVTRGYCNQNVCVKSKFIYKNCISGKISKYIISSVRIIIRFGKITSPFCDSNIIIFNI